MTYFHSSNSEESKEIFSITEDEDSKDRLTCSSVESDAYIHQTNSEPHRVSSRHVLGRGDREPDSPTSSVYILEGSRQNRRLVRRAHLSAGYIRRDTQTSLVRYLFFSFLFDLTLVVPSNAFSEDFTSSEERLLLVRPNTRFHCLSLESFVSICLVLSNYTTCSQEVQEVYVCFSASSYLSS